MNITEAVMTRKSVRDFKPVSVPKDILQKILQLGIRAPSASNAQPWAFTVISGEVLENVKKGNVEKLMAGAPPKPEYTAFEWPAGSVYRRRQVEIAKQLFELMDIPREDKVKRAQWMELGFQYFNAPAVIIITMDRGLPEARPSLDIGAVMQTICLAALAFGLGTCIENQGILYPDVIRRFAAIPETQRIITSIAIGYPNWDFPANRVASEREPLENITSWFGFG